MGLPHFTLNLKELFNRRVMRDFVGAYKDGRTPNPCVACNAHVKFHAAAFLADRLGFEKIATGHYARVADGPALARPLDEKKDQTYVLWPIPKKLLERTVFPLGDYRKTEVRRIAEEQSLAVAYTPESQDICFIPDGDYRGFVRKKLTAEPGDVVDREGAVLGRHEGVVDFTVCGILTGYSPRRRLGVCRCATTAHRLRATHDGRKPTASGSRGLRSQFWVWRPGNRPSSTRGMGSGSSVAASWLAMARRSAL
jgi:tRNA U34 2-thiouridine synthase MnmA/TrmU